MTTKRFLIAVLVFLILLTTKIHAQTLSNLHHDTQEWNDIQLSVPVTKHVDFSLVGTLRIGRDLARPVDERIGAGFTFKVGKYITASAALLRIGMQPIKGRAVYEDRASFPIIVRFRLRRFVLSDRNQFERRMRHPGVDATRYRNKLQLEHPIAPAKMKLSLFLADEVFYDWSFNAWVRNRAQVGVTKVLSKHFTGDLYYLRQNDSHSVPGDLHVIGTALRIKL